MIILYHISLDHDVGHCWSCLSLCLFTRLVSLGIPLFKVLDDNFMTNIDVPRWRPAMEGAQILAQKMEKRVLRISLEQMRTGGVSSVTQLARPQLWHAMAQLGPYLAMAGSKRLDLGTSSSLDSKKPGRDCPKIQKSFEETTRGGFLEVLCGFVELSSSVSTQFSTFLFSRSAGSY